MTAKSYTAEARNCLADAIAAKGPARKNLADSVRTGFSNLYIEAAIEAIASTVRNPLDEDD